MYLYAENYKTDERNPRKTRDRELYYVQGWKSQFSTMLICKVHITLIKTPAGMFFW